MLLQSAAEDIEAPAIGHNGGPPLELPHKRGADKARRLALADLPKRRCAQCGETYQPLKKDQSFCTPEHRKQFHNLRQQYGALIFDLAVAWRRKRLKGSFADFTRQLDQIIRDHGHELGHAISDGRAGFGRMSRRKS